MLLSEGTEQHPTAKRTPLRDIRGASMQPKKIPALRLDDGAGLVEKTSYAGLCGADELHLPGRRFPGRRSSVRAGMDVPCAPCRIRGRGSL